MTNQSTKQISRSLLRDEVFLECAASISKLSKDPSTKVGAVITGCKDQIISQGYNGFPRGVSDYETRYNDREMKYKLILHAEENAIFNAGFNGVQLEGSTIYINGLPCCSNCARSVIQSGIRRVVMRIDPNTDKNSEKYKNWIESFELSKMMFDEAGVEYTFID